MSYTSIAGAVGFAHQSAFGTVPSNSSYLYMPATSVGLNQNQNAQTLPAEVGGDFFLRGSYKGSVTGGGDVGFVARPNSLGHLLLMLCGVDTVSTSGLPSGAYQHTFTPYALGAGNLPWYCTAKDVAGAYAEQYLNTRMTALKLDVPKSAIMTGTASLDAITPSTITSASLGTKTFDSSPQFQTCIGSLTLTPEGSGSNISADSVIVERLSLNYNNNLSNDEFYVGSFYRADSTLLQRTVTVDMDFTIRDPALIAAVYNNGAVGASAWSPTIYRGTLAVTMNTAYNIPTTAIPYSVVFNFPGIDFLMMPVNMQGSDLIRATLSTQVTLGPSGSDRFNVVLTNNVASY